MDVIGDLKPRSGKSVKVQTSELIKMEHNNQIFYLILFSNFATRLCILMRNTDVDRNKIKVGKSYMLKNVDYKETIAGIPVFKITSKTIFRESGFNETDPKKFESEEVLSLKQIEIKTYYDEATTPDIQSPREFGRILSLLEFCNFNPKQLTNQYVEVVFF